MQIYRVLALRGLQFSQPASAGRVAFTTEIRSWRSVFSTKISEEDNKIDPEDSITSQKDIKSDDTYEEMKNIAHRSGDAAKEWFTGPTEDNAGSTIYKVSRSTEEELFECTKRGIEQGAGRKDTLHHESRRRFSNTPIWYEDERHKTSTPVKDTLEEAADTLERGMDEVKSTISSAFGYTSNEPQNQADAGVINARAEWEASRSEEQKQAAHAGRKAELTDEAYGTDNPKETKTRSEKSTIPDHSDTPQ